MPLTDITSAARPTLSERGPSPRPARLRVAVCCTAVAAAAALLSGCGSDSSGSSSKKPAGSASPSKSKSMDGMHGKAMGDPSATPANKIPDAEAVEGSFKLLDTRPPGMDEVKGTAWQAQGPKGTTVTVSLTGLKPGDTYMAHLHAQRCSADNGGEHFQFKKGGPAEPPNEIHLMFKADKSGKGMTTVNNKKKTGKKAVALVVHPHDAQDNRIACADFEF
ncbi:superoxide dismutase family protein [Streptomyces sp. WMMB 322]|uniref:superoxide dismutase family protein n=1 Tax=Streptomyces sp. WMMB 322 TaxID=1286821 RepID=UPI000D14CAA5|nr:superoxide dismutase family protein [Streptomyces sp. WMMB 322]